jgi:molybdopterin/thiamine biosynthesis adenylyltransferase
MTPAASTQNRLADKTALLIGIGGLGCPAAMALVDAGVGHLVLADDDQVDESNLPRQVLFGTGDVGRDKLDAAAEALLLRGARKLTKTRTRLLPENARELVRQADVIVEGSDNFATKFLAADASFLEGKPIVHGAGVRLHGTAWLVGASGRPCYRCLFEDVLPSESAPNCAEAGVLGPVVGILGALMADLALDALLGDREREGQLYSFDGVPNRLRKIRLSPRKDCPLCGGSRSIQTIDEARYLEPTCEAPRSRMHA